MPYSPHLITVDGVSLDAYAWNITTKMRAWPSIRDGDVVVPGNDGEVPSLNDDTEAGLLTLEMWLLGTDPSGVIPDGSAPMAECRKNLDHLAFLFGKRYALINIQEVVDSTGAIRQCWGKVADQVQPTVQAGGLGRFTVSVKIPATYWEDVSSADWSQASAVSGTTYEVTTLQGATGPVTDGVILVTGPATNPRVTDAATGAFVQLNTTVPAGQQWRVNCATWATRYGAGLTLGSSDTTGVDAQGQTIFGGGTARFLRLQPAQTPATIAAEQVLRTNQTPNPEPSSTLGSWSGASGAGTVVTAPWNPTRTAMQQTSPSSNANLVTNPGFETDLTGWTETDTAGILTLNRDTAVFHSGFASLREDYTGGTAGQTSGAQFTVSGLLVGVSYTFTAWVRQTTTNPNPIIAISGGVQSASTTFAANTWTQRTVTFTATATSHVIQILNQAAAGTCSVYVDDVSVVRVASVTHVFTAVAPGAFNDGDLIVGRIKVKLSNPNRGANLAIHSRTGNVYMVNPSPGTIPGATLPNDTGSTDWHELTVAGTLPQDVIANSLDLAVLPLTHVGPEGGAARYSYTEEGETLTVGDVLIEKLPASALSVERTNLMLTPNDTGALGGSLVNFQTYSTGGVTGTVSSTLNDARNVVHVECTTAATTLALGARNTNSYLISVPALTTIWFSADVFLSTTLDIGVSFLCVMRDDPNNDSQAVTFDPSTLASRTGLTKNAWLRLSWKATVNAGRTVTSVYLIANGTSNQPLGAYLETNQWQVEVSTAATAPTPYFDGNTQPGDGQHACRWTGTQFVSTSEYGTMNLTLASRPFFDGNYPSDNGSVLYRWNGTIGNSTSDQYVPALLGPGVRKINVTLTGTGFTSATAVAVRARRKFLQ